MKAFILSLFCLVFAHVHLFSQPVFAVGKENRKFLEYYQFWNGFDSSVVRYVFGEVSIATPTTVQRLNLTASLRVGQPVQEGEAQGISTTLQNLARTEEFIIPDNGEIHLYGEISSYRSPCDEELNSPEPGEGPNRPVLGWGIVDTTEFAIELVDAHTQQVLTVLSVVGVRPPTATLPAVDTRYGSGCTSAVHSYTVPSEHAGLTAYIRVSPRRYGASLYGMMMGKKQEWISLSSLYSSQGTPISQDSVYALSDIFFQKTLDYCDSVQLSDGRMPNEEEINRAWDSTRFAIFANRYYNSHTDVQGRVTHFTVKNGTASNKSGGGKKIVRDDYVIRGTDGAVSFTTAKTNIQEQTITVSFHSGNIQRVSIHLVSISGNDLGELWSGKIAPSPQDITLTLPSGLAVGRYILSLVTMNGTSIASTSFVLER